jgi:uncharacterized protein
VIKDIDRPLGQEEKSRRSGRFSGGGSAPWALLIGIAAVAAASTAFIVFRGDPFRGPEPVAASAETKVEPVEVATVSQESGQAATPSASTIRVAPEPAAISKSVIVIRDPSAIGQNLRVAHLPDRALIEQSELGPLPVRAADGRRPLDVYARPWSGARGARIAIVIGGLGLSQTGTQEAIAKLPSEVTLAFAPQGNSITRWMQEARREGHEIIMQLPLEPYDYPNVNPGRNTLTLAAGAESNLQDLRWVLGRTTNYTGVMNYMGARFSSDREAMAPVMKELADRGLLYLDDGSSAQSVAQELALASGVPFAAGDASIDAVRERGEILEKLDELERTARAKGFAIGSGSAFDVTVDAVSFWAEEAKKRGIEIVPVSALISDPERS